jgi:hypothetical protein
VAAVAKRLGGALAAGAPIIALAGFDLDGIGRLLGDVWFGHGELSSQRGTDIIADGGEVPLEADGTTGAPCGFGIFRGGSKFPDCPYRFGQQ